MATLTWYFGGQRISGRKSGTGMQCSGCTNFIVSGNFSIRCSLEKPVPLSLSFVELVLIQENIPKMKIKCFNYLSYFRRPSLLESKTVLHSLYFKQVNYGFLIRRYAMVAVILGVSGNLSVSCSPENPYRCHSQLWGKV